MKVHISTGASRRETNWKNLEVKWESFVTKLSKPVVTKETYAEYNKFTKEKQGAIKDVGGFVGGTVTGGRRLINSVSARSMITLDVDYANIDFYQDLTMLFDYEIVVYSTHKHSPETPRFRLIMPLSREVHADEYEAVARRIAGDLGIELFDPTTFQPERLMYWPSVSCDGQFYFERQKGRLVDPDEWLARYEDWRDVAQWPVSEKAKKIVVAGKEKQEDPLSKPGLVGTFCRVYTISDVIEKFLSEIYVSTVYEDRYTYAEGSTSAGLVVYDDKWALSHHSTDPVCGRLCNAFDLVRIHLFGDVDDRVEEGTPTNKKPSYSKMIELITNDDLVKQTIVTEKVEKRGGEVEDGDWMKGLDMDKKGNILNTISNVVTILENDNALKDCLAYDDLRKNPILKRDLPWRKVGKYGNMLTDSDDAAYRNYFEFMYGITSPNKIKDGMEIVIHKNKFHPVKDYLENITWDGKARLERLLVEALGAEDNVYVREVTRKCFVAAVARVYEPGKKFDHVMVLVGPQGLGKSRFVHQMAGEWYSDTFGNLQNKDAMEQIQGVWIMEIGELAGLKRHEVETIKLFISRQEDRFRVAYARRVETFARQCIFIGTTNNSEFLQDATGNRRFWPIQCGNGRARQLTREEIDQAWAEACHWYTMGEDLYLTEELEGIAKEVQEEYTEVDDRAKDIKAYLEMELCTDWYELNMYDRQAIIGGDLTVGNWEGPRLTRDWVTVQEIWSEVFKGQLRDMTNYNVKFIRNVMNKMTGWKGKLITRKPYGTIRGWVRESSIESILE